MKARRIALIPAAGVGERFGAGKPKQYVEIGGKTVLQHTLECFLAHDEIDFAAVILSPEDTLFDALFSDGLRHDKLGVFRCGGASRAETVRNGLNMLAEQGIAAETDWILVHDAARCCLPAAALNRLLGAAAHSPDGAILAVPVADTLKRGFSDGLIAETVSRNALWQAQTPQMFPAALLRQALSADDLNGITDEASAVERLGRR
ncbi:MAG: 2-C-methyl-D-erythritol 4-phosphate cytidylyltransferase, partial [Neisseria sp.]|nr:2-C-methyl-D-erythritol 4-phosphate cytidylyltransferase [Neisseria sp.]